jgi:hypothetical protein
MRWPRNRDDHTVTLTARGLAPSLIQAALIHATLTQAARGLAA